MINIILVVKFMTKSLVAEWKKITANSPGLAAPVLNLDRHQGSLHPDGEYVHQQGGTGAKGRI